VIGAAVVAIEPARAVAIPVNEHHEAAAGGDAPRVDARVTQALDHLRRHAVLLPDPRVAPTDESGPRYTEAASRQAAFVLNGWVAPRDAVTHR
jgi:hypothetical protein